MSYETSNGNLVDLQRKIAEKQAANIQESLQVPPNAIANYVSLPTEKGEKFIPIPLNDIVANIRNVEDIIKISETYYLKKDGKILALNEFDDLFSALQELGKYCFFKASAGFASKKEVFSSLLRKDSDFTRISENPSYPKCDATYYDCEYIEPENTGAVDELVAFFHPKTDYDKALIKALIVTPAWSHGDGRKPIFLIQSDPDIEGEKVNVGKTTLAHIVSRLYNGHIDLKTKTDADHVARQMVRMRHKKVVIYDNVKTTSWSNDALESMITATSIQGHLMYVGAVEIPNHFTYIITVNDPSISPDLASRAVPISLSKPPEQRARWQHEIAEFLDKNQKRLFADIGYIINSENNSEIQKDPATRFPVWEEVVLNKLIDQDVSCHIKSAQMQVNFENDTGWQDFLMDQMNEYSVGYLHLEKLSEKYNPEELNWFISSSILQKLYIEFSGSKNTRLGTGLTRRIKAEMKRLTYWQVADTRVRTDKNVQMRGYLLTVTGRQSPQKYYSPFDVPDRNTALKTFSL